MAKKKSIVTNAMRSLDKAKISYDAIEYETDGEVGENFGAKISEKTGISPSQSFKTLVARGEKQSIMVCCVPVDTEVDLKKLAAVSKNKKVEMIHVKELLALTGYIRGGVSPIGMKKNYTTYISNTCNDFDKIAISAGVCGCTLMMNTSDLISVTNALAADITKDN